MAESVLVTRDLTKRYGQAAAVNSVNLNVEKGQIYGLVGRNGAGKTTIIRMISGQTVPSGGELELFGATAPAEQNKMRRRTGAMVGASLPLFAFALGWGGVCVHLQVFSLFREFPVSRWVFRLFRFLHGLLSGVLCWALLPFFPQAESASSQWSSQLSASASAPIPAVIVLFVLLLVMALDGSRFTLFGRKKSPAGHDA